MQIVTGVSSFLGLLGLYGYLFFSSKRKTAERSIKDVIQGQSLFTSDQIIKILREFKDETRRLDALKEITKHNQANIVLLYKKIKDKVDVEEIAKLPEKYQLNILGLSGGFFLILAFFGLVYCLWGTLPTPASQEGTPPRVTSSKNVLPGPDSTSSETPSPQVGKPATPASTPPPKSPPPHPIDHPPVQPPKDPLLGKVGWIYVGCRINEQWSHVREDGTEPALTLDLPETGLPRNGKTYKTLTSVYLRNDLPQRKAEDERPVMTDSLGALKPGTVVKLDRLDKMEIKNPDRSWYWGHITVLEIKNDRDSP